jgi:hypothetical protein
MKSFVQKQDRSSSRGPGPADSSLAAIPLNREGEASAAGSSHALFDFGRIPIYPSGGAATAMAEPGPAAAPIAPVAAAKDLISLLVADNEKPGPAQMRKSEFLAALRESVSLTANGALAGTIWSSVGCPWIEHWFAYYGGRDSVQVERAVRGYAPEAVSAQSASDYISLVSARVRRGIKEWSGSGKLPELPPGLPMGDAATAVPTAISKRAQTSGGTGASVSPAAVRSELGPGVPLDNSVRTRLGSAAGQDVSKVRVHTDFTGAALSQKLNARAFTVGEHIAFGAGEYRPGTLEGDVLIAHELAHVAQQHNAAAATQRASAADLEADADVGAAFTLAGLFSGGAMSRSRTPGVRSGLRLSSCGPSAPEQIPMGMTKQEYWRQQFKKEHPEFVNIGAVPGKRDEGVMTQVGVRVPIHKGDMLLPRKFYEVKEAELAAYQGYIHYAELVEAGLGATAVQLSQMYRAPFVPDNKLDLYQFVGWAERAELARGGVEYFVAAGETANTYGDLAEQRAAARNAAKATEVKPVEDVPQPKKESVIVQGEANDATVKDATEQMAKRTGQRVVKLGKGTLEGADEVTVIAHGHERLVKIGDDLLTPEEFAQALKDSGWEGGTIRLATCKSGVCDPASGKIYAQELSKALTNLGKESAVIGADMKVAVPPAGKAGGGVPRVRTQSGPSLQKPGKGWTIYVE